MGLRVFGVLSVTVLLLSVLVGPASAKDRGNVVIVDCSQVQQISVSEGQYGSAGDVAEIAQELDISQNQVNACLGNPEEATTEATTEQTTDESTKETTVVRGETVIVPDEVASDRLPDTGGANLGGIILASGCALLGAGLILGRVAR